MLISINKINIGSRIRQEYGDIQELADSIREHGLLHPIVVDSNYNLVAGGRRLLACERNKMKEIDVKMLGELSKREIKILELEENIKRKDFTEIEKSRALTKLAELKAEELREKSEMEFRSDSEQNENENAENNNVVDGFRPANISEREIVKTIDIPRSTLRDAKQHVEAVGKYPELGDLPKYKAIETAKKMDNDENIVAINFNKDENYNQYLSKCKKTALAYNKSLYSLLNLDTSETALQEWNELLDELLICGYVEMVEELIPKLVKIQRFLKEAKARGNTNTR
ncbi:hypothetical protein GC105_09265 [Alkalibaculum sp. M08DMB]|uniref:ParB-like N-terminal domain-containing protein n=1 Tax=Alkalibaculum sporogenes TaxID=2655001 RepID=A0A6A7K8Z9_9FIRM|nr:ParB N-terminal domain-containing protein [Alkalibaculum sporogenes]MPW25979.1 hypothetical protein [Alkalibaculum sporogenes]